MPDDWDVDMDGDWEAPLVENPACAAAPGCGAWSKPIIDNPDYKGKSAIAQLVVHRVVNAN